MVEGPLNTLRLVIDEALAAEDTMCPSVCVSNTQLKRLSLWDLLDRYMVLSSVNGTVGKSSSIFNTRFIPSIPA